MPMTPEERTEFIRVNLAKGRSRDAIFMALDNIEGKGPSAPELGPVPSIPGYGARAFESPPEWAAAGYDRSTGKMTHLPIGGGKSLPIDYSAPILEKERGFYKNLGSGPDVIARRLQALGYDPRMVGGELYGIHKDYPGVAVPAFSPEFKMTDYAADIGVGIVGGAAGSVSRGVMGPFRTLLSPLKNVQGLRMIPRIAESPMLGRSINALVGEAATELSLQGAGQLGGIEGNMDVKRALIQSTINAATQFGIEGATYGMGRLVGIPSETIEMAQKRPLGGYAARASDESKFAERNLGLEIIDAAERKQPALPDEAPYKEGYRLLSEDAELLAANELRDFSEKQLASSPTISSLGDVDAGPMSRRAAAVRIERSLAAAEREMTSARVAKRDLLVQAEKDGIRFDGSEVEKIIDEALGKKPLISDPEVAAGKTVDRFKRRMTSAYGSDILEGRESISLAELESIKSVMLGSGGKQLGELTPTQLDNIIRSVRSQAATAFGEIGTNETTRAFKQAYGKLRQMLVEGISGIDEQNAAIYRMLDAQENLRDFIGEPHRAGGFFDRLFGESAASEDAVEALRAFERTHGTGGNLELDARRIAAKRLLDQGKRKQAVAMMGGGPAEAQRVEMAENVLSRMGKSTPENLVAKPSRSDLMAIKSMEAATGQDGKFTGAIETLQRVRGYEKELAARKLSLTERLSLLAPEDREVWLAAEELRSLFGKRPEKLIEGLFRAERLDQTAVAAITRFENAIGTGGAFLREARRIRDVRVWSGPTTFKTEGVIRFLLLLVGRPLTKGGLIFSKPITFGMRSTVTPYFMRSYGLATPPRKEAAETPYYLSREKPPWVGSILR